MNKKTVLYITAGACLVAALALVGVKFFTTTPVAKLDDRSMLALKSDAGAILMLKAKCGFETAIAREDACECEAAKMINLRVDDIENQIRENPSLEFASVTIDGGPTVTVKSLVESRRPLDPGCPQ